MPQDGLNQNTEASSKIKVKVLTFQNQTYELTVDPNVRPSHACPN